MFKTKQESLNQIKEQIDSLQDQIDSLKLTIEQLEQQQNILRNEQEEMQKEITYKDENSQFDSNPTLEKIEYKEQVTNDEKIFQNQAQKLINNTQVYISTQSIQYEEKVPVDQYLENRDDYIVYSDDQKIYNCVFNMTQIGTYNCKFYIAQLLKQKKQEKYMFFTRWGRVGVQGQMASRPYENLQTAINDYDNKVKEKIKQGYMMIETVEYDATSNRLRNKGQTS